MLKNELRRLREEDIRKVRERQKRLEWKKKEEILQKEKVHFQIIDKVKQDDSSACKQIL